MALEIGDYASIGSTFLGDLATIREGAAIAGQAKINRDRAIAAGEFTARTGAIDVVRQTRQARRDLGSIRADASGLGRTQGGSALDILRSSASEAALDIGLTRMGTQEAVNTFEARAEGFQNELTAAKKKKKGGILGAIGGLVGGAVGFVASGFNPMGAVAGAKLGSGAGKFIGSM